MNEFGGNLRFSSPLSSDEGIYQCFADNGHGVSVSDKVRFLEAVLGEFHDTDRVSLEYQTPRYGW